MDEDESNDATPNTLADIVSPEEALAVHARIQMERERLNRILGKSLGWMPRYKEYEEYDD